jgi:hypothetical protein
MSLMLTAASDSAARTTVVDRLDVPTRRHLRNDAAEPGMLRHLRSDDVTE